LFFEDGDFHAAELPAVRRFFEAVGLKQSDGGPLFFTGTASRIGGIGLDVLAREAKTKPRSRPSRPITEAENRVGSRWFPISIEYTGELSSLQSP